MTRFTKAESRRPRYFVMLSSAVSPDIGLKPSFRSLGSATTHRAKRLSMTKTHQVCLVSCFRIKHWLFILIVLTFHPLGVIIFTYSVHFKLISTCRARHPFLINTAPLRGTCLRTLLRRYVEKKPGRIRTRIILILRLNSLSRRPLRLNSPKN